MIDAKQAINSAFAFVDEVYAEREPLRYPRLEEVELLENENHWLVTVSFLREEPPEIIIKGAIPHETAGVFGTTYRRVYKGVLVDAQTGEARTMKMRAEV